MSEAMTFDPFNAPLSFLSEAANEALASVPALNRMECWLQLMMADGADQYDISLEIMEQWKIINHEAAALFMRLVCETIELRTRLAEYEPRDDFEQRARNKLDKHEGLINY